MKIKWWHIALALSLLLALLAPLASSSPDGLEKVAEDEGFAHQATASPYQLIADYVFPGIENEALATVLAGIVGTVAIFAVVYALAWLLRRRQAIKSQ